MSNKDAGNQSDTGEEKELPRDAGGEHDFDEDTEEAIRLPKVKPELTEDDGADKKNADSAFDDLEIEIDEDELKVESEGETPGRRY
jgi:hypothetical protein